jgi:hypothetical protein
MVALARAVFGLIGQPISLLGSNFAFLALKNPQQVHPRRPPHLFQPLHWYHGRQRFSLALNYELVVAARDSIQNVSEPLANLKCGNLLCHLRIPTC